MLVVSMGHKILKDHAHTICQMFVGWRMTQDLEIFATIPEGQLTIDVLRGECKHESLGPIDTYRLFGDFRGTPRPIHGGPTIG